MTRDPQKEFDAQWARLQEEFKAGDDPGQTDEELAQALLELILDRERARHGVLDDGRKRAQVDQMTLERMQNWDTDNPELAILEKVLRRLATGRAADAVVLVKTAVDARLEAVSRRQRERAMLPRRKAADPFTSLIETLVARNPAMTENDLFHALRRDAGGDVIARYDDLEEEFHAVSDRVKPMKRSALKNRLNRARKKSAPA